MPLTHTWCVRWTVLTTPIGDLGIAAAGDTLGRITFDGPAGPLSPGDPLLDGAAAQLRAYFAGELTAFDLPLAPHGGSAFERAVWDALGAIPYAEMRTYGEIAAAVGGDPRAVGVACNHNRLPVVLPCHRVVGAGGKLVGFGGGLPRKRFLLELEARVRVERDFAL